MYLIHFPVNLMKLEDYANIKGKSKPHHVAWAEMEQCVKLGLAKSIGLSNFNV